MAKDTLLTDRDVQIAKLESKIKELEAANLQLQEYFSKVSGRLSSQESISPFSGNPSFSCVFKFTIDLELQKVVWLSSEDEITKIDEEKLFLADVNTLSLKLIAKADKKRFRDIVLNYSQDYNQPIQTLFRINQPDKKYVWVLACFEKVTYQPHPESYLQVQFVKLDESKELLNLFCEFSKKSENCEQYQKVEMLTSRQREILSLLGKGFTSKEIACALNISFHTVEAHRKSIAKKTSTRKRAALISLAAEVGMLN